MSNRSTCFVAVALVALVVACGARARSEIEDAGADVALGVPLQPDCGSPNPKNPNKQLAPAEVGRTSSVVWTIRKENAARRPQYCPGDKVVPEEYPAVAVEVTNPTTRAIEVSVYHSRAPNAPELDTRLWLYSSTEPPTTPEAIGACITIADSCNVEPKTVCGNKDGFNFAGVQRVRIGPACSILVYNAGYDVFQVGQLTVNVRLDKMD